MHNVFSTFQVAWKLGKGFHIQLNYRLGWIYHFWILCRSVGLQDVGACIFHVSFCRIKPATKVSLEMVTTEAVKSRFPLTEVCLRDFHCVNLTSFRSSPMTCHHKINPHSQCVFNVTVTCQPPESRNTKPQVPRLSSDMKEEITTFFLLFFKIL